MEIFNILLTFLTFKKFFFFFFYFAQFSFSFVFPFRYYYFPFICNAMLDGKHESINSNNKHFKVHNRLYTLAQLKQEYIFVVLKQLKYDQTVKLLKYFSKVIL